MEFDNSHDGELEPLIQIQAQECDIDQAITIDPLGHESAAELLSVPPEVSGEGRELEVDVSAQVASGGPDEPALGVEFDSPEDARAFYSTYAERIGFRIRNSKSFTSRVDDTVIMRRFVCSKQGRPSKKDPFDLTKKRRNRSSSREGCNAMLQVNRRDNGRWAISRCVLDHCHSLGILPNPSPSVQKKLAKKPWELLVCPAAETHQNGPVSFITPYNESIASAAAKVFPNVRHRFCKRDIFSKCKDKLLGVYSQHLSFKGEFKKCVNESETVEEFDSCWRSLLSRYNLEDNMWLQELYAIQQKWVPLFYRGTFFGEFFGAPKLETMYKFFQRHSITTTTLRDLVTQFDKAMVGQFEKELQADFDSSHTKPVLRTPSPMEKRASEVYTKTIFALFQEELSESAGFLMEKVTDGVVSKYHVTKVEDASKAYIVTHNASSKCINCSCSMFEFSGIQCRHVLRVLIITGILTLPDEYILKRWTKNAKSSGFSCEDHSVYQNNSGKNLTWRCNDLCRDAIKFAEAGATSAVIYKVAKGALQKAFAEIFAAKKGSFSNAPGSFQLF
ncbi:hypothetical protein ZIOFF_052287 [Zingiber officinale]|uniref:Protein FAR1-RELATED SEQUENCE n=1 Tax=Zingiber officinale TaxID=94328 RepID=A0A8J5FU88_ZINOF|nr:hypothetical protein ZIOFF_052287 [Zingiber officinale]